MKRRAPAIAALALLSASLPSGATSESVDNLHRCQTPDGLSVYTDGSCARFSASPTVMSDELLTRIAMSRLPDSGTVANGYPPEAFEFRDASEALPMASPVGRRSPAAGCARTPRQLALDLRGSFALHDVNRLAESYHWVGMGQREAMPVMDRLSRLSGRPLENAHYYGAWIGESAVAQGDDAGVMQLVFAEGSGREVNFQVLRHSGCFFISDRRAGAGPGLNLGTDALSRPRTRR